jgi:hypothetical protein
MAHDLREALARGREEFEQQLELAAASPDLPKTVKPDDIQQLAPEDLDDNERGGSSAGTPIVRLLDALLLNAITKESTSAAPDDQPAGDAATAGGTQ